MVDFLLVMVLGFVGSFSHCVGMCGPLAVSFALMQSQIESKPWQRLYFHSLLNLGRIISYGAMGAVIGALSSVLGAGGQLAGLGSGLRSMITLVMGILLIWLGILQLQPRWLPQLPVWQIFRVGGLHDYLQRAMGRLGRNPHWWTPAALGMLWGLVPCGFLYAAQIKAAATGDLWLGSATMLCFGWGTFPLLLGIGMSTALISADRRSQLFRLGGWLMLSIGLLTVFRTGAMADYSSHAALLCLMLALLARPISNLWAVPLCYRRCLGLAAFVLSLVHVLFVLEHTFAWTLIGIPFMLPSHQWGLWAGMIALLLLVPLALTSHDGMIKRLARGWRRLHLLAVPALMLAGIHSILIGSHYLGGWAWTGADQLRTGAIASLIVAILLVRCRWFWTFLCLGKYYASPLTPSSAPHYSAGADRLSL
ncbi:MAG: sulfite exporter TauE/SafE family protein [Acaryochloridaceae cyanobacterium SU_2_1]|nr:sulfite exporter TauE/SafE family protein [Acaryochloridaceae cyanobacterium SU_2_1]